jgi:arginine/lysine/ornithine decarboxylase
MLPRDAFFAETEMVDARAAPGRIAAEQLTPYPPGIPTVVPGEQLSSGVVDYLTSGIEAGMNIPDATDRSMKQFRVVR